MVSVTTHRIMTMRVLLMTLTLTVTVSMSSGKVTKGCPNPVSPKRGIFRLSEDKLSAEFFCQPGHTLIGHREVACKNDVWTGQSPVCVGSDCEIPSIREASIVSLHGGGLIRIQCRSGFTLRDGTEVLACIDGQWNSTKPRCIDKTKELQSEKASKMASNLVGKHPKSESREDQASKRSHKEWLEDSDYSCVRHDFTLHPPPAPNARVFTRWAMYDGLPRLYATYQCKWGFKPSPGGVRNVYCRNGEWVGLAPKCLAVVYEDHRQRDSGPSIASSHEDLLLYADYTCIDGGSYDDAIAPPVLKNALNNALRFVILEGRPRLYMEYTCSDGFELESARHAHLYCKEKRWIGEMPKCVPVSGRKSKNLCKTNNGGCSQMCSEDGRQQVVCSCKNGYQLQSDKVSCTDVDECEVNNGDCDHLCDNTLGSFDCKCFTGYWLQSNGQTCSRIPTDT